MLFRSRGAAGSVYSDEGDERDVPAGELSGEGTHSRNDLFRSGRIVQADHGRGALRSCPVESKSGDGDDRNALKELEGHFGREDGGVGVADEGVV